MVKGDETDFANADTGEVAFTIPGSEYRYGQVMLGSRYWLDQNWMISVEASTIFSISSGLGTGDGVLLGLGLGYHFK